MADGDPGSWYSAHKLLTATVAVVVITVAAVVALGVHYWHEPDYWLVGIPGFGTAIGTVGLAGATFRLLQREGRDRQLALTALTHSQIMADEAARQRRDARARLLRVTAWGAVGVFLDEEDREQPLENGSVTVEMPRDALRSLTVYRPVKIDSADDRPMSVSLKGLRLRGDLQNGNRLHTVPFGLKGQGSFATFVVERTIAQWVEIAERRESGALGKIVTSTIEVDDGFDDGVIDRYDVVQGGCPIRRSEISKYDWIVDAGNNEVGQPLVTFTTQPVERSYFVSKRRNKRLGLAPLTT